MIGCGRGGRLLARRLALIGDQSDTVRVLVGPQSHRAGTGRRCTVPFFACKSSGVVSRNQA
jgi:hypothetical protein